MFSSAMTIHLVRHASAGIRGSHADDSARPLDERGRAQALAIADLLAASPIDVVYTSPALRCIETVEPLAVGLGIDVVHNSSLSEGSSAHDALALIETSLEAGEDAVFCSHGDLIPDLLQLLVNRGLDLGSARGFAKGSVWTVHTAGASPTTATYAPTMV
jgi:8-oxo-dGTP diphosphatase